MAASSSGIAAAFDVKFQESDLDAGDMDINTLHIYNINIRIEFMI